jgi:uncharacterized membrane protein
MAISERPSVKVLVVGESWVKHTVHMKGFDQFHTTEYEEGGWAFLDGLTESGFDVTYLRSHEISIRFPVEPAALAQYDAVVLSDVGANSFLLTDEVFLRSERSVNRLAMLSDYVKSGGGLVMVGGYMSFSGIDGRARFGMSPLASVLPVHMLDHDDRVEMPEGAKPTVEQPGHAALGGIPSDWPLLLGYNRLVAKAGSNVLASIGEDPLLVLDDVGDGRAVAFASDFAPHWAPPAFVQWPHYSRLWASIVAWAAGDGGHGPGRRQQTMKAQL